jgi:hypothetical protein
MPGRIRLRISRLKQNPAFGQVLLERLSAVQGIRRVEVNPVTGSVLVLYDGTEMAPLESLISIAETLTPLFPEFDLTELEAWLDASADGSHAAVPWAENLSTFLGMLNTKVGAATGGVDLKLLLPLALFLLGIRGLLVTGKGVFPTWYDLLWFSFGTFFMLNPGVVEGRR